MALSASTVFQIQSTATAANANGAGFNPANANFIADGVISSGTGNTPTLSSATYPFVSGDAGAWIYLPVQTGITVAGSYQIASVSGGVATLSAAVGQGSMVTAAGIYFAQIAAGVASTASLTGVKFGVDYSQSDSAAYTATDLTGAATTCTSATNPFTPQMVGNLIHMNSGTGVTIGWYEIVSVSGSTATLDRTAGTSYSSVTYHTGGAASLGSSTAGQTDANLLALGASSATAGVIFFIKGNGASYTLAVSSTTPVGNLAWHSRIEGYALTRGDRPIDLTRPLINGAAVVLTISGESDLICVNLASNLTSAQFLVLGVNSTLRQCKVLCRGGAAAVYDAANNNNIVDCEIISYTGIALQKNGAGIITGCYIHDSSTGAFLNNPTSLGFVNNIVAGCLTQQILINAAGSYNCNISGNTLYGSETKIGIGLALAASSVGTVLFRNNILYGLTTGVSGTATNTTNYDDYNNYNNNTTDISTALNWQKGPNDLALNPNFVGVTLRSGSTATTVATNHFVQTGATFITWGITAGVDIVYVSAGTGTAIGYYGILSVDSETQLTLDRNITANATADKVWKIRQGNNFAIGTNLKAAGTPGIFPGGIATGYLDIGAVQRQEAGGSASASYVFGS